MSKLWLVALNEFKRNVFKKSFIFALLSVPLIISLGVGLGIIMESLNKNNAPVGYVDYPGLLSNAIHAPARGSEKPVEFIPFQAEDDARSALESESIQAYYVLSPDYSQTSRIELIYLEEPGQNASRQFYDFIQINLVRDLPTEVANRAVDGSHVTIRSSDGSLEFMSGGPTIGKILPLIISLAFVFLLMMSSGYLMSGVMEEKINCTIEVLMTSLSPAQMVVGKVLGIVAISFAQLITWTLVGVLAVAIGGNVQGLEWFQNPSLEWGTITRMIAIAIPSYVMASAVMFALGSTVAEAQEGQSVGGLFFMLHILPIYMIVALVENPNGALAVALSLLPFTSLITIGLRSIFSVVPIWQIAASVSIQTLCALGAIWLAVRAFRLGMLRYGKRLRLGEIFGKSKAENMKVSLS
jgi:ABC-2 type transport system permease protein